MTGCRFRMHFTLTTKITFRKKFIAIINKSKSPYVIGKKKFQKKTHSFLHQLTSFGWRAWRVHNLGRRWWCDFRIKCMAERFSDQVYHRGHGVLHLVVVSAAALHVRHVVAVGQGLCLRHRYLAGLSVIRLHTHDNKNTICLSMFSDFTNPMLHIFESWTGGHIETREYPMGTPVVRGSNSSEPFRPRDIPYLQFDHLNASCGLSAVANDSHFKVHADG